jgi:tetratricopeptide (TPR) repeat protein
MIGEAFMRGTTKALVAFALFQAFTAAYANEYGRYDVKQVVAVSQSSDGQNHATISFSYLDQIITDLASHAADYPPRFDSPKDLKRAQADVTALSAMLDTLSNGPAPNQQLLLYVGILNSIGHNLDVPATAQRAISAFTRLLQQAPEEPRANFFYGKFLADAGKPNEAIPMLEKAKSLGVANADYVLGIAYMVAGNNEKALENFELYAKRVPNDPNAAKMIDAIRNGNVQLKKVTP